MSIRTIRAVSATLLLTRAAALVAASALAAGGLLAAGGPAAYAAPACSAATVTADTAAVARMAGTVNSLAGSLSTSSSGATVQTTAQSVTNQLATMINELGDDADSLQACSPLSNADSQTVATAYSALTTATVQMLNALTGAHRIFAQFGVTRPIVAALRSLEDIFDFFSVTLTQLAPSQAGAITAAQGQADNAAGNTISTYEQACIPSPLYPTIPPICVAL